MGKGRLEAFSDGVLAIIITIMVLELKIPEGASFSDLSPLLPHLLSYVLSFVYIGIYWNNHHHMLHAVRHVSGAALWANMHLLFWLSLVPLTTHWMGETRFAPEPAAAYGMVLLGAAVAYFILSRALVAANGPDSPLAVALGKDVKGKLSIALYAAGILAACRYPWAASLFYVGVAVMWLVPDRRIETALAKG
jgi:uncharacterized membrane protein